MFFKTTIAACTGILLFVAPAFAQVDGGDIPAEASAKAGMNADGQRMGRMPAGDGVRSGRSSSMKMMRNGGGKSAKP